MIILIKILPTLSLKHAKSSVTTKRGAKKKNIVSMIQKVKENVNLEKTQIKS